MSELLLSSEMPPVYIKAYFRKGVPSVPPKPPVFFTYVYDLQGLILFVRTREKSATLLTPSCQLLKEFSLAIRTPQHVPKIGDLPNVCQPPLKHVQRFKTHHHPVAQVVHKGKKLSTAEKCALDV